MSGPQPLGPGWDVRPAPNGGCELRVSQRNRGCLVIGAGLIAVGWAGFTAIALLGHAPLPLGVSPAAAVVIGLATITFAVWCARADEVWHIASNCLDHRVGIGHLAKVRSYRDGEIAMLVHWNRWGKPFGRLYVVDSSGRHYLLERDADDASAVAGFLCSVTGWRRRDFAPGSSF